MSPEVFRATTRQPWRTQGFAASFINNQRLSTEVFENHIDRFLSRLVRSNMEAKKTFAIGDRVEQKCVTCGEERGHIVASVTKGGKITRVSCPICGSRVPYTSGTTRRASSTVGA